MGSHKTGLVSVGAFVENKLRDYIDKFAEERDFLTRSDAIRAIIREHRAVFSKRVEGSVALTPSDVVVNDDVNL